MTQVGTMAKRNPDGTFCEVKPIMRKNVRVSPAFEKAVQSIEDLLVQKAVEHFLDEKECRERHRRFHELAEEKSKMFTEQED